MHRYVVACTGFLLAFDVRVRKHAGTCDHQLARARMSTVLALQLLAG